MSRARAWLVSIFLCAGAFTALSASAQPTPPAPQPQTDAQQRAAAAEAFDRGTAAYLAQDFGGAAAWFETANRLAPATAALTQAVRAHDRAGNTLRAGTLAIRLLTQADVDPGAMRIGEQALARAVAALLRVDVTCSAACTLELDGTLQESASFFVDPNVEHTLVAHFAAGRVSESLRGGPGETRAIALEAPVSPPPPPPPPPVAPPVGDPAPVPRTPPADDARDAPPLSPWVIYVGLGVTTALAGATLWSGLDALAGVDAYEAHPTAEGLEDGRDRELRTNALLVATGVIGVAVTVLAIFQTDWDTDSDGDAHASFSITSDGANAAMRVSF